MPFADADTRRPPSQEVAPSQRFPVIKGAMVDYFSRTFQEWMPTVIREVDPDTGAVGLECKPPGDVLTLQEHRRALRARTRPSDASLQWLRETLRNDQTEEVALSLFNRCTGPHLGFRDPLGGGGPGHALREDQARLAGREVDKLLGVSGSSVTLLLVEQRVTADVFVEWFWDRMWTTQKQYGQTLTGGRGAKRTEDVRFAFEFEKELGRGTFGAVFLCHSRESKLSRAVKVLSKDNAWASVEQLEKEIEHLCVLDHPHIVKLYEYFEDRESIYLVMDYCAGGDLNNLIAGTFRQKRRLAESWIADVMKQLLLAITHVHCSGLLHLDLKSANIMLAGHHAGIGQRPHVMVIDLGIAQNFRPGNYRNNVPCGTPQTMAPEVWFGELTPKADVFSLGVVLFEMLAGGCPFPCPGDNHNAQQFWWSRPEPPWVWAREASEAAVKLCHQMLLLDKAERPDARKCLKWRFIQTPIPIQLGEKAVSVAGEQPMSQQLVRRLATAADRSVLYKSVALAIAQAWPADQLATIKGVFHELDVSGSGRLEKARVAHVLEKLGVEAHRARESADAMDFSRDGAVDWTEFVAACISLSSDEMDKDLQRIFKQADCDGDGMLSGEELSHLLAGEHLRGDAVRDVLHDLIGRDEMSARVDFTTFRRHFRSHTIKMDLKVINGNSGPCQWEDQPDEGAIAPPPPSAHCAWAYQPEKDLSNPVARQQDLEMLNEGVIVEGARRLYEGARQVAGVLFRSTSVSSGHSVNNAKAGAPEVATSSLQENLQRLEEMGFTDRDWCASILRRHRNRLSPSLFDDLGIVLEEEEEAQAESPPIATPGAMQALPCLLLAQQPSHKPPVEPDFNEDGTVDVCEARLRGIDNKLDYLVSKLKLGTSGSGLPAPVPEDEPMDRRPNRLRSSMMLET